MSYPIGINTRVVTGSYTDTYIMDGVEMTRPTEGYVVISPCIEAIKFNGALINPEYLESEKFWLTDGSFETELIVTTDPSIDPISWTYKAEYSWLSTPVYFTVEDSTDPLILSDEFMADPSTGIIIQKGPKGDQGDAAPEIDGVTSIVQNGSTLIVTYTDGTVQELAFSSGGLTTYTHVQSNPANTWIVNHNLGKHITSVYVTFGTETSTENQDMILCPWQEIDMNSIRIFAAEDEDDNLGAVAFGHAIVS